MSEWIHTTELGEFKRRDVGVLGESEVGTLVMKVNAWKAIIKSSKNHRNLIILFFRKALSCYIF